MPDSLDPTAVLRSPMEPTSAIKIPVDQLPPDTLRCVIEEFVTRDGTELTEAVTKIQQVEDLLRRGDAEIWFDQASQSCNIIQD